MAVTSFKPEVWNAGLLSILDKALVFGGVANRNYEGDISEYGDTVHITDVDDVTIGDYTPNTDLSAPEVLTTNEQLLLIDQAKSFHFYVDDVDARQVRNDGALMNEAGRRAAFGLRDKVDTFLAGKQALAASNALGVIDGSTVTNVYDKLVVPAGVALDEANVPEEMRWLIISPAAYGLLQLDSRFIKQNESGTDALHNGVVGMAGGFRIMKSNNAFQANRAIASVTTANGAKTYTAAAGTFSQGDVGLSVAGTGVGASSKIASVNADGSVATGTVNSSASATITDFVLSGGGQLAYAGSTIATTYADQILKTVAYSPERRFGDAVKGLHVYGAKVIRPEALVVASVKVA